MQKENGLIHPLLTKIMHKEFYHAPNKMQMKGEKYHIFYILHAFFFFFFLCFAADKEMYKSYK